MLKKVTINNFKAWHKAEIDFGKITGFFGTNSAGKSSLLQFLLMLKATKETTDRGLTVNFGGPGTRYIDLGTFRDVIHKREENRRLSWNLSWKLPKELKIDMFTGIPSELSTGMPSEFQIKGDTLENSCEVAWRNNRLISRQMGYKFAEAEYRLKLRKGSRSKYQLDTDNPNLNFIPSNGSQRTLGPSVKTHLFPDEIKWQYQNADFLNQFENAYEKLIDSIFYLAPIRAMPQRDYQWAGSSPKDVGIYGHLTIDAILAARRDGETRTIPFEQMINSRTIPFEQMIDHQLKRMGLANHFRVEEIVKNSNLYRTKLKTSESGPEVSLTDVGFGVSQVLPTIVLLYHVPEGSTILIEQPELHLHPSVQSEFADVMLDVMKSRNVQIIVESHSEHLLRRLQLRVAESKVPSEEIKLFFVSEKEGKADLSDLSLNQYGEIENWPNNFFGDEMGEITAIVKASLNRKRKESE